VRFATVAAPAGLEAPAFRMWGPAAAFGFVALAAIAAAAAGLGMLPAVALVLAPAIAYLVWHTDPVWPLSIGIAVSVFSANSQYLGFPIGPDRILIIAGLLALAFRAPGARRRPVLHAQPVHWLLAVTVLYAVVSAVLSGTVFEHQAFFALLDRLAVPFLMFFVAPAVFATARQRSILLATLVVTGGYLGLTALFEALGVRALVFPKYILDPSLGIHEERARGPFLEAVANGLGLYGCGVAAAVAFARYRGLRWARVGAVVVLVLCAAGVVFTLTRAVWIASAAATIVALSATPGLRRLLVPAAAAGTVLVVTVLVLVPGLSARASERENAQLPVWSRLNVNSAAVRMVGERPLLGFGWGRFVPSSGPYLTQHASYPLIGLGLEVHNVFLGRAVDLGLIGAAIWLAGLIAALGVAAVTRGPPEAIAFRAGLIALIGNWIIVANFGPLGYAFPNLLLWTWAGIVWGWRLRTSSLAPAAAAIADAPIRGSVSPPAPVRVTDPVPPPQPRRGSPRHLPPRSTLRTPFGGNGSDGFGRSAGGSNDEATADRDTGAVAPLPASRLAHRPRVIGELDAVDEDQHQPTPDEVREPRPA
jgi:putative inorganic carbon (HCO3(-)) transporter